MKTRREYLVDKGMAKPGKGKFSNDAKAELVRARASGIKFSDDDNLKTVHATKPVTDQSPKPTGRVIEPEIEYRYSESDYIAVEMRNNKRVIRSLREVCRNARVSLVVCPCDSHMIVAHDGTKSVPVTIEKVKSK